MKSNLQPSVLRRDLHSYAGKFSRGHHGRDALLDFHIRIGLSDLLQEQGAQIVDVCFRLGCQVDRRHLFAFVIDDAIGLRASGGAHSDQ